MGRCSICDKCHSGQDGKPGRLNHIVTALLIAENLGTEFIMTNKEKDHDFIAMKKCRFLFLGRCNSVGG